MLHRRNPKQPGGNQRTVELAGGVPARTNDVKPRLPEKAILHENTYTSEQYEEIISEYDDTMQQYYSVRSSKTMAAFLAQKKREHMKAFLESKGFNKK